MFSGLSAFPLTPMDETGIDEAAFTTLISRLASAGVDSIGALGSTGSYAYLNRDERNQPKPGIMLALTPAQCSAAYRLACWLLLLPLPRCL